MSQENDKMYNELITTKNHNTELDKKITDLNKDISKLETDLENSNTLCNNIK